jgi:hypothetical protein
MRQPAGPGDVTGSWLQMPTGEESFHWPAGQTAYGAEEPPKLTGGEAYHPPRLSQPGQERMRQVRPQLMVQLVPQALVGV